MTRIDEQSLIGSKQTEKELSREREIEEERTRSGFVDSDRRSIADSSSAK